MYMYHHDYLCADDRVFISFIKVIKFLHRDLTKTNDINWLLLAIFTIKEITNYLLSSISEN